MSLLKNAPHYLTLGVLLTFGSLPVALGQSHFLRNFRINVLSSTSTTPPSNSVSQIDVFSSVLWIGTSKGLARSADGASSWQNFRENTSFANDGIFAVAVASNLVWAATGYDKSTGSGSVQTGSGYAYSTDDGLSWRHLNQVQDQRGDSILSYGINDSLWILPVVVPEQNVTFDAAFSSNAVWVASWASGLRKTTDLGQTWQRIILPSDNSNSIKPTDTLWSYAANDTLQVRRIFQRYDPRKNNNYLAFSVHVVDDTTIWCGTAGGVNKSTDGGISWAKFSHQNQASGILGNWVIAIDHQRFPGFNRVWTTNWRAADPEEQYGVSYTDDEGRTWTNLLHDVKAYDFGFKDSIVYIATDNGLYRTSNGGLDFTIVSSIVDPTSRQRISTPQVFSVDVLGDTVFVGTADGLASTVDDGFNAFGASWKIYRAYQQVGTSGSSYAYPNPFAPNSEVTRIHYRPSQLRYISYCGCTGATVDIDIFDFGMNRVRSLIHSADRSGNQEQDEIWDGRTDGGKIVANGVYFYRIKMGDDQLFGKILVIQ